MKGFYRWWTNGIFKAFKSVNLQPDLEHCELLSDSNHLGKQTCIIVASTFLGQQYHKLEDSVEDTNLAYGADKTMIDCINAMSVMPSIAYKGQNCFILPTSDLIDNFYDLSRIRGGYPLNESARRMAQNARVVWCPVLTTVDGHTRGTVFQYYKGLNLIVQYYFHDEVAIDDLSEFMEPHLSCILDLNIEKFIIRRIKIDRDVSDAMSTLAIPQIIFSKMIDNKTLDVSNIYYHCSAALAEFRTLVYAMSKGDTYRLGNSRKLKGMIRCID